MQLIMQIAPPCSRQSPASRFEVLAVRSQRNLRSWHSQASSDRRKATPQAGAAIEAEPTLISQLALPLVGLEFLEALAGQLGRALPQQAAMHRAICVSCGQSHTLFDFLPESPTQPGTAFTLLSGKSVKGVARERALLRLPRHNSAKLGHTCFSHEQSLHIAREFCKSYSLTLSLRTNDCKTFSDSLAQQLLTHR